MSDTLLSTVGEQWSADQAFSGSLSNGVDTITIPIKGYGGIAIGVSGIGSNVAVAMVSLDGTNFFHSTLWKCGGSSANPLGQGCTSIGEDTTYIVLDNAGMTHLRLFLSTFSAGTVTFSINFSNVPPHAVLGSIGTDGATSVRRSLQTGYRTSSNGHQSARTPDTFKDIANVAVVIGAPATVWIPAAGKKFRLMCWDLSLSVAGQILIVDQATTKFRTSALAAGVGRVSPPMGNGYLSTTANNVLKLDVSANGNINGFVGGTEE